MEWPARPTMRATWSIELAAIDGGDDAERHADERRRTGRPRWRARWWRETPSADRGRPGGRSSCDRPRSPRQHVADIGCELLPDRPVEARARDRPAHRSRGSTSAPVTASTGSAGSSRPMHEGEQQQAQQRDRPQTRPGRKAAQPAPRGARTRSARTVVMPAQRWLRIGDAPAPITPWSPSTSGSTRPGAHGSP